MKYLKPLQLKEVYYSKIEKELKKFFYTVLIKPLLEIVEQSQSELRNSKGIIEGALLSGRIYYSDGVFKGKFDTRITKELRKIGAVYDAKKGGFVIEYYELSKPIRVTVESVDLNFQKMVAKITEKLNNIQVEESFKQLDLFHPFDDAVNKIDKDFRSIAKSITIPPDLTKVQKASLARNYNNNMNLYIKNFVEKEIQELRGKVEQNVMAGNRASSLVKMIEERNGVSKNKAKFLARQETSLLTSKMREERFKAIGVTKYKWRGAMDKRERPDHKALQNKIFSWDNPPVTDLKTGARNNPGEDYNCRCVAIPIVE